MHTSRKTSASAPHPLTWACACLMTGSEQAPILTVMPEGVFGGSSADGVLVQLYLLLAGPEGGDSAFAALRRALGGLRVRRTVAQTAQ